MEYQDQNEDVEDTTDDDMRSNNDFNENDIELIESSSRRHTQSPEKATET